MWDSPSLVRAQLRRRSTLTAEHLAAVISRMPNLQFLLLSARPHHIELLDVEVMTVLLLYALACLGWICIHVSLKDNMCRSCVHQHHPKCCNQAYPACVWQESDEV